MANWFVDYSATNNGDGTTAAQATGSGLTGAFNTFAGQAFTVGDKVWIRRITATISSPLNIVTVGVYYIGWPKTGDDYFSVRPATGTSNGWDSDSNNQLIYNISSSSNPITVSGTGNKFYRLKGITSVTGSILTVSGNSNIFNTCYFGTTAATFATTGVSITGISNTFINQTFDFLITSGSAFCVSLSSTALATRFYNVTLNCQNSASSGAAFLTVASNYNIINGLTITGTTFTIGGSAFINMTGSFNRVVDVNFSLPSSVTNSFYVPLSVTGNYNYVYNVNGSFGNTNGATTVGSIVSVSGAYNTVYLNNMNSTASSPTAIVISGSANTISISNSVFNCTTTDITLQSGAGNNKILANNCKFSTNPMIAVPTPPVYENILYSNNHNQQSGLWKALNVLYGEINTSAAVRTGGETFSLKFEPKVNLANLPDALPFGLYDSEQTFVSVSSGARTVTVYGAYKFYNTSDPPISSDVWIEMDYQKSNGTLDFATSFATAPLTSDSSVWSNESGLTMFSITLSFTAGQTAICPLRIYCKKWSGNAVVYIDPKAVIT